MYLPTPLPLVPCSNQGRNVLIEQSFGGPKITKDGVTVSSGVFLHLGERKRARGKDIT